MENKTSKVDKLDQIHQNISKSKIIKVRDEKGKNAMDTEEIQRMVRVYFNNIY